MAITIRPLSTLAECEHFQKIQIKIWGGDEEGVVPTHVLITLAHNGGLVMGAYADDGPADTGGMVGILAGWLGADTPHGEQKPRIKMCSHMAGVLPAYQRQHVGLQLKLAQAEWVRKQGFTDWITWTFDPLYRANGVFNIHRLGATCCTYIRDLYGEMTDVLNAGGPSDRCQVDWWVASDRARNAIERTVASSDGQPNHALAASAYPHLQHSTGRHSGRILRPPEAKPVYDGRPIAVAMPDDIAALRRLDRDVALEWRYYVRRQLEAAFAANYQVVDCLHVPAPSGAEWCYVLTPAA